MGTLFVASSGHKVFYLVITRCDENFLSKLETFDPLLSDHLLIHCNLRFAKQVTKPKLRAFRKMRSFDIDKFWLEVSNSELLASTPVNDPRVLVDCYNSTLHTLEGFSIVCRKTKTKVITLANHKGHR